MTRFAAEGLTCLRGERLVFANLDFVLTAGKTLLLVGPNGSGKSSLLRVLAGLLRPWSGSLTWDGRPLQDDLGAHHERLHYLGHLDAVKPALTVRENLSFWVGVRAEAGAAPQAEATERGLAHFDLLELADLPARLLSSGQRRRLALARLLATPAPLWLLDEPTVGLDRVSLDKLDMALAQHRATGGLAVVATHVDLGGSDVRRLDLAAYPPTQPESAEGLGDMAW